MTAVAGSRTLRDVFAAVPSGVTAVASVVDGDVHGMVVSSFTSVSLEPPLISVCMGLSSESWPTLRRAHTIGLSVLSVAHEKVARRLGGAREKRFDDVVYRVLDGGAVRLEGASAWFGCQVEQEVPAGDHHIVVLRVSALGLDRSAPPLVFHGSRFRHLLF